MVFIPVQDDGITVTPLDPVDPQPTPPIPQPEPPKPDLPLTDQQVYDATTNEINDILNPIDEPSTPDNPPMQQQEQFDQADQLDDLANRMDDMANRHNNSDYLSDLAQDVRDLADAIRDSIGDVFENFPESPLNDEIYNPGEEEPFPAPMPGTEPPFPGPDGGPQFPRPSFQDIADFFFNPPPSPLVLDLDGDGIELTSLEGATAFFDVDINGFAQATGWVGPDDGLLALDVNSDGVINNGSELFGDQTGYDHGFLALAAHDGNGDGVIDVSDSVYGDLLVWQDANADGLSQASELRGLADVGIASISLAASATDYQIAGNAVLWEGSFSWADGTTGTVVDAYFEADPIKTVAELPDGFTFDAEITVLPTLQGAGALAPILFAMSQDAVLRQQSVDLVTQASSGDIDGFMVSFREFVYAWAGVADVDPNGRGAHVNGRNLAFLEAVFDQDFFMDYYGANPHSALGQTFDDGVNAIIDQMALNFLVQVPASNASLNATDNATYEALLESNPLTVLSSKDSVTARISSIFDDVGAGAMSVTTAESLVQLVVSTTDTPASAFSNVVVLTVSTSSNPDVVALGQALVDIYGLDIITGTAGDDVVSGTDSDNVIFGSTGNDTLHGGDGSDTYVFTAGDGQDVIDDNGWDDTDVLSISGYDPADLTLLDGGSNCLLITFAGSTDTITINGMLNNDRYDRIEEIRFDDGTVWNTAEISAQLVAGQSTAGDDVVVGTSGVDTVYGEAGNDTLHGGDGSDTFIFNAGDGQDVIDDNGWYDTDVLAISGYGPDDLVLTDAGSNALQITFVGSTDSITINGMINGNARDRIEEIHFDDGTVWDWNTVIAQVEDNIL